VLIMKTLCHPFRSAQIALAACTSQTQRVLFLALFLCVALRPNTAAGLTSWTNPSLGDWFIGSNWSNGVPDATTSTYIANGATVLLTAGPATAGYLDVGGPAGNSTLLLSNSGALSVGKLTVSYNLYVGGERGETGTLNILNGASLVGSQGSFAIAGFFPQTQGTMSVNGAGSQLFMSNLLIADSGTASLTVSGGGLVISRDSVLGAEAGSSGTVSVTGSGSIWANLGGLTVGGKFSFSGGAASVNIVSNGLVSTGSLKIFDTGLVIVNNGSSAVAGLTISYPEFSPPAGGTFGDIVIGDTTGGRMEISGGGLALNRRGFIGQNAGAVGAVTVSGAGSRWDCTGSVWSGNSGAGSLNITSGGVVSSAGNGYLGFSVNSSGSAVVSGAGSSWITAVNLYVGGNGAAPGGQGILQIENGGVVGATLTTVYNSGYLRLGANPTLNGSLTFLGGFIQPIASTTFGKSFSLGSGGAFVQTSGFELTLSGNISGSGGLTKYTPGGAGTLKLTGNNTYTGATAINGGTVLVNGSITSATSVNGGGTLAGSGAVGTVTVLGGGTVSPGSSAGRLTINGNYTQTSGGALTIELGGYTPGTGFDQLAVSGNAAVGGTLNLTLINKFRPHVGDTFAIITSSSESGNFSTINGCGFTVRSDASPGGILLTITQIDPPPLVTNNNDDGPGSLRFVIAGACPDSIVTFAANVRGAITLSSGELLINKNLTINGPGANLLSVERGAAAGNFRIFAIASSSVTATITGLTIANGNVPGSAGGGIYNFGTLTLGSVTLSGNKANLGGNGGGIFNNFGILTIIRSTLSGNSVSSNSGAGSGGGIFNHGGTLTIASSTISGNTAIGPGGNSDSGGGIITNVGSVTLTNSTISGNSGDLGGGIRNINGGIVRAKSTIIALNNSASGPDMNGPLTSDGFNLIGNAAGSTISPAQSSDRIGVTPLALNLGLLGDNGGPTQTHALGFGSVAIDQGNSDGTLADERGFKRRVDLPGSNPIGGDGADIGAYEFGGLVVQPELGVSRPEGGVVSINFLGAPFTVYTVKFVSDLNGVWVGIGNATTDADGNGEFQHTLFVDPPPNLLQSFYRLEYYASAAQSLKPAADLAFPLANRDSTHRRLKAAHKR
jgi:T5SS/PEP-CTERM-associated repeat protein/autotransporter-associated beta strand protein